MKEQNIKLAYFLPNTFTALNMACGMTSILLSFSGKFYEACFVLILGSVFDSVDGRVARLTGTESAFGEQFDSMSDLVSFGMAPALMFYFRFLSDLGRLGMIGCFIYLLCGALRLARFNANIEKVNPNYFQGLPIPGSALCTIGYILLAGRFKGIFTNDYFALLAIACFALLMISNIPFPSFKKSEWVANNKRSVFSLIVFIFILLAWKPEIMAGILPLLYVVSSLVLFLFNRKKFEGCFNIKDSE